MATFRARPAAVSRHWEPRRVATRGHIRSWKATCARSTLGVVVPEMERAAPLAVPLGQVSGLCARCLLGFVVHALLVRVD